MANEVLTGALGGGLSGAGAGASFGPWGAGIGAGLGLIGGALQGADARKKQMAYQKAENGINPVNPEQVAILNRLRNQERAYRSGSDPSSAFAMQGQQNALAQTQANLVRNGMGSVSNLLRSQQAANMGLAQVGANAAARADQLLPLQQNQTNMISDLVYQRQRELRNQALARSEQARQNVMNTFAGGLAVAPQIAGQFGGGPKSFGGPNANFNASKRINNSGVVNPFVQPQQPWNAPQIQGATPWNTQW